MHTSQRSTLSKNFIHLFVGWQPQGKHIFGRRRSRTYNDRFYPRYFRECERWNQSLIPNRLKKQVQIVHALRKKDVENIPTRRQISTFLAYYRSKTRQINRLSVGKIKAWCEDNAAIPTDIDKFFVAAHDVNYNEGSVTMRMFFTTRRLLEPTEFVSHVSVDGTYKLNYQGFPCIMIGTTDKQKRF